MEEQNFENRYTFDNQVDIPNSTVVLVLGIISIVTCVCYGVPGLICGIIALVLAGKSKMMYEVEPELYTISSINNLRAGRICAIVGVSLSGVIFLIFVAYFALVGALIGGVLNW